MSDRWARKTALIKSNRLLDQFKEKIVIFNDN